MAESTHYRHRFVGVASFAAALSLSACARYEPGVGLVDVESVVRERSGESVSLVRRKSPDDEVKRQIDIILAEPLTSNAALEIAIFSNPMLQAAYESLDVAQAEMVEAKLLRNPVLSADARFGGENVAYEFSLVGNLLGLLYQPLRARIGEAQFARAKVELALSIVDFASNVRGTFFETLAATSQCDFRKRVVDATDASLELATKLHAAGNITDLDLANERVLHEESKLLFASASQALSESRERLNALMGLSGERATGWRLTAAFPEVPKQEIDLSDVERKAIEKSLSLEKARYELDELAGKYGLARPFALFGEGAIGVTSQRETDGEWSTGPSVAFALPIFDWGGAVSGKAEALLNRAVEKYRAEMIELDTKTRAAKERLVTVRQQAIQQQRIILPLRRQIVSETQRQYNAMLVGAFQLIQAKRDEIDSSAEYLDRLLAYWRARLALERLMSGGSVDGESLGLSLPSSAAASGEAL